MKSVLSVDRIGGEGLSTDNTERHGKLLDIFHHEGHEEHEAFHEVLCVSWLEFSPRISAKRSECCRALPVVNHSTFSPSPNSTP